MFRIIFFMAFLFGISVDLSGQDAVVVISGRVIDESTGEYLSYAVVRTREGHCGTIANEYGQFQLRITNGSRRVIIQSIGYINLEIVAVESKDYGDIKLKPQSMMLNDVTIRPKDSSYLFDLIESCRTTQRPDTKRSKACFELKSFSQGKQIELVEAYYNASQKRGHVTDLRIKSGRLALQPHDERYFLSLDGSRAITSMKVFERNNSFPATPLEYPQRKSKDYFYLYQYDIYLDEHKDTVLVIGFDGRDTSAALFSGYIHVNTKKKLVLKMEMNCRQCKTHPFIPIFPDDETAGVDMHLKRVFNEDQSTKQINFHYRVNYISRLDFQSNDRTSFSVNTYALMHFYDGEELFFEPMFQFPDNIDDYRMLNALPYNDFFWKWGTDLHIDVNRESNDKFFHDVNSITNLEIF